MTPSRRLWLFLAAAALAALAPACGKKGPPIKPAPRLPAAPRDFVARQRGAALELSATYELVGLRGRSVRPPLEATLLYIVVPGAANTEGWTRASRDREFLRSARELELGELDPARVGETLRWSGTLPLQELVPSGNAVLALALRDRWGRSLPSRRSVLMPQRPPLAPLGRFDVEAGPDSVRLSWSGGDEEATHVRIYRRVNGEGSAWKPWAFVPASAGELLDESVSYGQELVYSASASLAPAGSERAAVESTLSDEVTLHYRDVFPPNPPQAVDAVSIEQRIRILWNPGRSPDETRALVERQAEGEDDWIEVGRVDLPETFLVDEEVVLGRRYRYRVTALDQAGNAGEPAGPTEWVEARPPRDERRAP